MARGEVRRQWKSARIRSQGSSPIKHREHPHASGERLPQEGRLGFLRSRRPLPPRRGPEHRRRPTGAALTWPPSPRVRTVPTVPMPDVLSSSPACLPPRPLRGWGLVLGLLLMSAALLTAPPPGTAQPADRPDTTRVERGTASYYGDELAGRPTASGERFDPGRLTAAHRSLPFGAKVRVTNLRNGRTVVVRINDRGPFTRRRIIDLSYAAARRIGMVAAGTAPVRIELLR